MECEDARAQEIATYGGWCIFILTNNTTFVMTYKMTFIMTF